jgi:hypothetical protein
MRGFLKEILSDFGVAAAVEADGNNKLVALSCGDDPAAGAVFLCTTFSFAAFWEAKCSFTSSLNSWPASGRGLGVF